MMLRIPLILIATAVMLPAQTPAELMKDPTVRRRPGGGPAK